MNKVFERICCDLDNTICFPDHSESGTVEKYGRAIPNPHVIDWLRDQKSKGAYIIIYTARRMKTHNGVIEKVKQDIGELTSQWLRNHQVPYDELIFGKPFADVYIDDKAMLPQNLK